MSVTAYITRKIVIDNAELSKTETQTAGGGVVVSEEIPIGASSLVVTCAIDYSAMKYFYAQSDKALTLVFFNGAVEGATVALAAGQAKVWTDADAAAANPITADTTVVKVTNASGFAAALEIRAGQDVTPP